MWNYFFGRRNFLFSMVILEKTKLLYIICIKAYWYCVSACPVVKLAFPYFRLEQNITNSASIDTIRIPLNNPMATMIIGVIPLLMTEVHLTTTNLLNKGNRATSQPQTVCPTVCRKAAEPIDFSEIADMQIGIMIGQSPVTTKIIPVFRVVPNNGDRGWLKSFLDR